MKTATAARAVRVASGVAAITDAEEIHISAATVWKIEIKRALGKLEAPTAPAPPN